jgi:hypothetical protein
MEASFIVSLGAFLFAGISLFVALKDRGERSRIQIEQKKQETLGKLWQVKIANNSHLDSLKHMQRLVRIVTAPISVEEVEHQIAICEALDRDMREYITEIEQDKEVTLVALENTLGTFHVLTMRLEKIGTDSEAINVRLAERLVEPSQ